MAGKKWTASAFAKETLAAMREARRAAESPAARASSPLWSEWTDGLHPALRAAAHEIVRADGVELHSHVAALNSSMVFAFNLFMPFRIGDSTPLAAMLAPRLGRVVEIQAVTFEYAGPLSVLAETRSDARTPREPCTTADVAIAVRDHAGRNGIVLIEVKLTEGAFRAEAALLDRERDRSLWDAVESLPEHERTAIALYYLADHAVAKIGTLLGVPANTIKQRLHSARKRIRERSVNIMSERLSNSRPSAQTAFSNQVALFLSIRSGDEAAVRSLVTRERALLEAQETWDASDWPERDLPAATRATPLIRAAERGDVPIIAALLDAGALVDGDCGCWTGETPLWAAVVTGHVRAARELLRRGADPRARSTSGITCLHAAAMRGQLELCKLLLAHGADPRQPDREGRTAADWARLRAQPAVLELLGADGTDATQGHEAKRGDASAFQPTGIKALDLFAPLPDGSFVLVQGGPRVGRNILIAELAETARQREDTASVWVMWPREVWSDAELELLLNETHLREHIIVLPHADEGDARQGRDQPARALALAERLLATGRRHVQLTFFERPGVRTAIEALLPGLGRRKGGSSIGAFVVPPWQLAGESQPSLAAPFDACIGFDRELATAGCWPAVHAQLTCSRVLREGSVDPLHVTRAAQARALLALPRAERAERLRAYLTQPFVVAEPFSGRPGVRVALSDLLADIGAIIEGEADAIPVEALAYRGVLERA